VVPTDRSHWLELRSKVITSTEVPALFGLSPYKTAFELWHEKRGQVSEFNSNERVKWGTRLEASIASGIAEDMSWNIRKKDEFIWDDELKLGASFDFEIENPKAILEIKNVDSLQFSRGWIIDGDNIESPPHIELQIQTQLAVSGLDKAWIGALIGGNRVELLERNRDEKIIEAIKKKVSEFWARTTPPEIDWARDSNFIISLYGESDPGKVIDATGNIEIENLAKAYKEYGAAAKEAEEKKAAVKAQILSKIDRAEKVFGEWGSISSKMISGKEISYFREGYRDFRINIKELK